MTNRLLLPLPGARREKSGAARPSFRGGTGVGDSVLVATSSDFMARTVGLVVDGKSGTE
jgi:hypothetical protein